MELRPAASWPPSLLHGAATPKPPLAAQWRRLQPEGRQPGWGWDEEILLEVEVPPAGWVAVVIRPARSAERAWFVLPTDEHGLLTGQCPGV
jgi:hypothetical protein